MNVNRQTRKIFHRVFPPLVYCSFYCGVEVTSKEVLANSEAVLTCTISGLSDDQSAITWQKSKLSDLSSVEGYTVVIGSWVDGSQISTLTVKASQNIADTVFTCVVTPSDGVGQPTEASLNVFVVTPVSSEVIVGNTATLTCIISGISKAQTDVIWKKKGSDNLSTVKGYGVDIGTFTDGRQSTTLTLDGSINVADTTYTCDVTPTAGGTAQSTDVRLSVFVISMSTVETEQGTVGIISCTIGQVNAAAVDVAWGTGGKVYSADNVTSSYTISEGTIVKGTQTTTLTITPTAHIADTKFTCLISIAGQVSSATLESRVFNVSSTGDQVKSLETATLTCVVMGSTGTPTISWYNGTILHSESVTTETEGVYTSVLTVTDPLYDTAMTCSTRIGEVTATSIAALEINDLALTPEVDLSVFSGSVTTLTCTYTSSSVSEGDFVWVLAGEDCIDCSSTDGVTKSVLEVTTTKVSSWKCGFTKTGGKEIKSNTLVITPVELTGTLNPASVWGVAGSSATVICTVPDSLYLTDSPTISWSLEGQSVDLYTTVSFDISTTTTTTSKTSQISFTHSSGITGVLKCLASYSADTKISPDTGYINTITLSQDVTDVSIAPGYAADIVFTCVYNGDVSPSVTIDSSVVTTTDAKKTTDVKGGKQLIQTVDFALVSAQKPDDWNSLQRREEEFVYKMNDQLNATGKVTVIGESYIAVTQWVSVGSKSTLTAWVTLTDSDTVQVEWSREIEDKWKAVPTEGYSDLASDLTTKGTKALNLVIDNVGASDLTNFRCKIVINSAISIVSSSIRLSQVTATPLVTTLVVFETSTISLKCSLSGPVAPVVKLVHQESGSESDVTVTGSDTTYTGAISVDTISITNQGSYTFKATFGDTLSVVTESIVVTVRIYCRPLTTPANTQIVETTQADSDIIAQVECVSSDYQIGDSDKTAVLCNTSSGSWNSTELSPCLKVVAFITDTDS